MTEYRITKYNPKDRKNGVYGLQEWTSVSDIGKIFDAGVLTDKQYKTVEQAYIDCCIELLRGADIFELSLCNPEYYDANILFPRILCTEIDIRRFILCCLQEKCWAKLEAKDFFLHFGYDYYMYIGTNLPCTMVDQIVKQHDLFCEMFPSPYRERDLID